MIEKCGGTIVAHRPWQDGRLAYAVNGHRKGLHYLTYFKMQGGDGIRDLNRACKLSELVLRHVVILHPQAMFDAMVQAISGEWHPHEAAQDDAPAAAIGTAESVATEIATGIGAIGIEPPIEEGEIEE